ncbi:predicted protein [Nematostella vectensis]|uniref:Pseudouridine synthase I TruA alpha/beta domain-containing protein n=1 Tax=Nematostella vectensis TaxID=45351 RepID=A7SJV8_NEMVE|nr:predicted protein [Nematostella vectensis]|eukprot:XP_001628088.1 predicted protein [Nematostella vectensis]
MADGSNKLLEKATRGELIEIIQRLREENKILMKKTKTSPLNATISDSCKETREFDPDCVQIKRAKSKPRKEFDFSRYNTRRIALRLSYLGWDMHGFASQEKIDNTVEAHLFDALIKACLVKSRESCSYSRCGRTDKGVSAFGQVISLNVRTNLDKGPGVILRQESSVGRDTKGKTMKEILYVDILNKVLPKEIRVLAWAPVELDFDARFSCSYRKYKYLFPSANLDIDLMNLASKKLEGEHDFRNFCKMDVANGVIQFTRNITSFKVQKVSNATYSAPGENKAKQRGYEMCEAVICGSAFLWHQVRCMMSILLMVGQGLEQPEVIDWLLDIEKCPQRPQYNMASELPLVLYDCVYEGITWIYDPQVLESVTKNLQQLWNTYATKATLAQELLASLDSAEIPGNPLTNWSSFKPMLLYQSSGLVPGQAAKTHKKLCKRAVCESLEEKLEGVNAKRRKSGKEPFTL